MTSNFTVVLRGYDRDQVEQLLARADAALASNDEAVRASARELLERARLTFVLRGYDTNEVDDAVRERLRGLGSTTVSDDTGAADPWPPPFVVVLRGYDMAQVDDAFAGVETAIRTGDPFARATARDALLATTFTVRLRGYGRAGVDRAVQEAVRRLA